MECFADLRRSLLFSPVPQGVKQILFDALYKNRAISCLKILETYSSSDLIFLQVPLTLPTPYTPCQSLSHPHRPPRFPPPLRVCRRERPRDGTARRRRRRRSWTGFGRRCRTPWRVSPRARLVQGHRPDDDFPCFFGVFRFCSSWGTNAWLRRATSPPSRSPAGVAKGAPALLSPSFAPSSLAWPTPPLFSRLASPPLLSCLANPSLALSPRPAAQNPGESALSPGFSLPFSLASRLAPLLYGPILALSPGPTLAPSPPQLVSPFPCGQMPVAAAAERLGVGTP